RDDGVYRVFFQAEDGIRDDLVTGVQTCALPIYGDHHPLAQPARELMRKLAEPSAGGGDADLFHQLDRALARRMPARSLVAAMHRSEERRVGKDGRTRRATGARRDKDVSVSARAG